MNKLLNRISIEVVVIVTLCICIAIYTFGFSLINTLYIPHPHLKELSLSFMHGKLFLEHPPLGLGDIAFFNGKYYLFYGPFPSLLLIPFVRFIPMLNQHLLLIPFLIASCFCLLKIFFYFTMSWKKSTYLACAFYFGTFVWFLITINITAYLVQLIGVFLLIISLYFYICRKNVFLSSIFFTFAVATRYMLLLGIVFFITDILLVKAQLSKKLNDVLIFCIPLLIGIYFLGQYDIARFYNPLVSGYEYNITDNSNVVLSNALAHGLFSADHIPGNIYNGLLKSLIPIFENSYSRIIKFPYFKADPSGLSVVLSSPFLLYVFVSDKRDRYFIPCFITMCLILFGTLMFFSIGWGYGYRYALDFYPFLFIILAGVFRHHFTTTTKALIIWSILFNAFFMYSIWGAYPFLPRSLWPN